jgi:hypothetical protein
MYFVPYYEDEDLKKSENGEVNNRMNDAHNLVDNQSNEKMEIVNISNDEDDTEKDAGDNSKKGKI